MIKIKIDKFKSFFCKESVLYKDYSIEILDENIFILAKNKNMKKEERIDISFLSLIHGNEVGGIDVLINVLTLIEEKIIDIGNLTLAFSLGNSEAALKGIRFLETDLNRAFGNCLVDTKEQRRAKILEKLFLRTFFLVDFHQTENPTKCPFLISKYNADSFKVFQKVLPDFVAVTYHNETFVKGNMTTINYQLSKGGLGFGIELGEKGFCNEQKELGVNIVRKLINAFRTESIRKGHILLPDFNFKNTYQIIEGEVSLRGDINLKPSLIDMSNVKKGEYLGKVDKNELYSKYDGKIVFLQKKRSLDKKKIEVFKYLKKVREPFNILSKGRP